MGRRSQVSALGLVVAIAMAMPFFPPRLVASDGIPIKVFRYRDTTTGAHAFTTDPKAREILSGAYEEETGDELANDSPFFYLYRDKYDGMTPLYRFEEEGGAMVFAVDQEERRLLLNRGFREVGEPAYVYTTKVEGASEIYRLTNPAGGDLVYTTSDQEKSYYLKRGWVLLPSLGFTQSSSSSGTGVLTATTVKLEAADLLQVVDSDKWGEKITFSPMASEIRKIQPGTVIYSEKCAKFPFGLVRKVVSLTTDASGGVNVLTKPAGLAEAFRELHLYLDNRRVLFPHRPTETGAAPTKCAPRHSTGQATTGEPQNDKHGRLTLEYLADPDDSTISLPDGDYYPIWSETFSQYLYGSQDSTPSLLVSATPSIGLTVELVYNSAGCPLCLVPPATFILTPQESIDPWQVTATGIAVDDSGEVDLISIEVPFDVGGPPLAAQFDVYLGYTASGQISARLTGSQSGQASVELEYDGTTLNGYACMNPCPIGFSCGYPPVTSGPTCTLTASMTGSLNTGANASVYLQPQLGLLIGALDTGLDFTASLQIELAAELSYPDIDLEAEFVPDLSAELDLFGTTVASFNPGLFPPEDVTLLSTYSRVPTIGSWSVTPTTLPPGGQVTVQYTASESGGPGLSQAQLWRAQDSNGQPVNWEELSSQSLTGDGPTQVTLTDTPTAGTYWYGTHLIDVAGSQTDEPAAVQVSVTGSAPVVTSLSPSGANVGGSGFPLTVNGSKFVSCSVVQWNGSALPTTYVSAGQLTASVPATDIASTGTALVTVYNESPWGGLSNAVPFNISGATPAILQVSPNTLDFGATFGQSNPPPSQAFWVTNSGTGLLTFSATVTNGQQWLSLSSSGGTAPGVVLAEVALSGLGVNTYSGTIQVTANAANSPQYINVTLTISSGVVLTVNSVNPSSGVWVSVGKQDNNGSWGGNTPARFFYNSNTVAGLNVPQTVSGNSPNWWTGCDAFVSSSCTVTLNTSKTVTVYYGPIIVVDALDPNGNEISANVAVSPPDLTGLTVGTTEFALDYARGTPAVTLTAPSSYGGNPFGYWGYCDVTAGATCGLNRLSASPTAYYLHAVGTTTTLDVYPNSVPVGTPIGFTPWVEDVHTQWANPGVLKLCDADAQYCEDSALLATSELVPGITTINLRLGPGTHHINAVSVGTPVHGSSTSSTQTVTVSGPVGSATALAASGTPGSYTLTATVTGSGSPAPTGAVTFEDTSNSNATVATASLQTGTAVSAFVANAFPTGTLPGSIAIGDFNGDGNPDIAVTNANDNTVSVLLGNGDGTFQAQQTYATGSYPSSIAAGDFNDDGALDLVVTNQHDNTVSVLLGNGNGTFQAQRTYATGTYPNSVAVADFNGDGNLDLAVTNQGDNTVSVLLGSGSGTFLLFRTYPTGNLPTAVAARNFRNKGVIDLAVTNQADNTVSVLLGNGDGTFNPQVTYPTGNGPTSLAVGDFNGDGKPDLAVANGSNNVNSSGNRNGSVNTVSVLLGNGDGTFQQQQTYEAGDNPSSVAVGDFNGDGYLDLAVTNLADNTLSILLGNGTGSFTTLGSYSTGNLPWSVAVGDFIGHGESGAAVVNQSDGTVSVFLQQWSVQATATNVSLPLKGTTHAVLAAYSGDNFYAPGNSTTSSLMGTPIPTSLSLSASPTSSTYGQSVTLTAVLTPYSTASATTNGETVTFQSGVNVLGTGLLSGGVATLTTSSLSGGPNTLIALYTPSSSDLTFQGSESAPLNYPVGRVVPVLSWATPAAITYPTPLSATQLDATSSVAGTFAYSPAAGTVLAAGVQTLSATFTPTDTTDYTTATDSVQLTVNNPVPTATGLSPKTAAVGGAAFPLTVTGTNFVATSTVQWNGTGLVTAYVSSTQLTASVPASDIAATGTASVTVVNPTPGGGTTSALTFSINNPVPTATLLSPSSATAGGAAFTLSVTGANFVSASAVQWNGTGLATAYASSTQLTASVPAGNVATAGTASVTVVNPSPGGGTSSALTFTINNPVPTATLLSPSSGTAGGAAFTLTITGTNFVATSALQWNGTGLATAYVSSTQLTASVPAGDIATAGTASVTVVNPSPGGGTTSGLTFTINNPVPTVSLVSPSSATAGGAAFTLTVRGTNFVSTSTVQWNGTGLATAYVSSTQLTASVPAGDIATAGTASVTVVNPSPGGGTSSGFTCTINNPVPTATLLSPSAATAGGPGFTLTVTGTNFVSTSAVQWNGTGLATAYVSSTQLTASVPASDIATAGTASVTVVNPPPGGGTSNALTFTINNPVPTASLLSPSNTAAGGPTLKLTVTGTNFVSTSTVQWNGTALGTAYVSSTQLTASVPAGDIATAGTVSVTVVNPPPGGGTSNALTFTFNNPVPTATSLSPSAATAGGPGFTLTVTGTNFVPTSTVQWNGTGIKPTSVSTTQLTASVPAGDIATAGTASVTVVNPTPGGGTSNALTFTINNPVPTATLLSPSNTAAGGPAFKLTVTGTNFVSSSVVQWNSSGRATTFVSATQLTAVILAGDIATAGTASVTVFNPSPGGGTTSPLTFIIKPAIAISGVKPGSITLVQGGNAQSVGVKLSRYSFGGSVLLATSTLPSGVTATFTQPGTGDGGSIRLKAASSAALVSNQTITITASGNGVASVTATFSLTVAPPSIAISSVSPGWIALVQGGGAQSVTVDITREVYAGMVTLATGALPSGVEAIFKQPGLGSSGSISLSAASNAALVSNQAITITASGSGVASANATFSLTVNAPSNAVSSVNPGSIALVQGGSAQSVTVDITRSVYIDNVTLATSTLPSGVTATFTQPGTGNSGSTSLSAASNATSVSNQTITILPAEAG